MKTLTRYIAEKYENYRLTEVAVKFGVKGDIFIVEVPESYTEDSIQTYLDDTIISRTFVGPDYSQEILGTNADNVVDAYFEYSGMEDTALGADLRFDSKYAETNSSDKLKNVKFSDFKFVVRFDRFDILNGSADTVEEALIDVFKMCVSDEYQWPIKLTFDPKDIEYKL